MATRANASGDAEMLSLLQASVDALKKDFKSLEKKNKAIVTSNTLLESKVQELETTSAAMDAKIKEVEGINAALVARVKELEDAGVAKDARIQAGEDNNKMLKEEVDALGFEIKMLANTREQRDRNPGGRFHNVKVSDSAKKNSVILTNELYDTFLKSIFEHAKNDGLIESIPEPSQIIEYTHILPSHNAPNKRPPPPGAPERNQSPPEPVIITKFVSRNVKYIVHKYKKKVFAEINENRESKIEFYDDLTKVNLDCLRFLKSDVNAPIIEKAFVLSGKIKFALKSNPDRLLTVKNPFTRDIKLLNKN